jgi:hypothetical protein
LAVAVAIAGILIVNLPRPFLKSAFALLAAAAVITVIAYAALYGNHQPAFVQLVHSCTERSCGDYDLLDCDSAGGGSLYVYARADKRFLADCDTANAARFTSQPLCSKVFEALKSCAGNNKK